MIEKMTYVSIAGKKTDTDYIIDNYISKFDLHTENIVEDTTEVTEEVRNKELENAKKFTNIQLDFLDELSFIYYRFGKLPYADFLKLKVFADNQMDILILEGKKDGDDKYIVYLTPKTLEDKYDGIIENFNFEEIDISNELLTQGGARLDIKLQHVDERNKILKKEEQIDLKKYISDTTDKYFIFSGFMPQFEADLLKTKAKNDNKIIAVESDNNESTIPTKLKNYKIFAPFEFLVRTYGVPKYGEIDPTPIVAIFYTILFGMMFGDVGQGGIIFFLGKIMSYKFRGEAKENLGKIISSVGVSSMFFGILYGSVFGYEHFLPTLWVKPLENINYMLGISLALGVGITIFSIILNIINNRKDIKTFSGQNSVAGLAFYILAILSFVNVFFIALAVIPFIFIFLKDKPKGAGIFKAVIETFEILLTFGTNTLSFVRVGAFALSHAGMMGVVFLLAQNRTTTGSFVIIVLGNLVVMVLEAMVVSIQALRLQFYEMFSRYFNGSGEEFVAIRDRR